MSELTQLLRAKSMMRYLPAKGTAGLARFSERILKRSPWPPARITARTLLITQSVLSARPLALREQIVSAPAVVSCRCNGARGGCAARACWCRGLAAIIAHRQRQRMGIVWGRV